MKKLIIIFLLLTYDSFSQSLSVFDIDTSAFPTINAKFYAFDNSGNQILNLSPSDFEVTEDGVKRNVTNISCPSPKPPVPISSVLTIDISGSMTGAGIGYAKEAAKAWVQALPLGQSECAITSFNSNNFFNQDFTTNRNRLLNRVENISISGGGKTFDVAFLDSMSGALLAVEKGMYKKVIVLITDGKAIGNEQAILQKAKQIDATIFCITIGSLCPNILKNLSDKTNGLWFENITTEEQAREICLRILQYIQGKEICQIEWLSETTCRKERRKVEINLVQLNRKQTIQYISPYRSVASLEFSPVTVWYKNKLPLITHDTTIKVTAINSDFDVTNILISNPAFSISPTNFKLKVGESINLKITYIPPDSNYNFSLFEFENDKCQIKYFASGGFLGLGPKVQTLKILSPNGGEFFVAGSDTIISWEGIPQNDTVKIEYSIDNGVSWKLITDNGTGFQHIWKNISLPSSNQCLVRVKQFNCNPKDTLPHIEWQNTYEGYSTDFPMSIQETKDGGYIVVGYSGLITMNKQVDAYILKINPKGIIEWQKILGGTDFEQAYYVIQTLDGGYIFAAVASSNDGDVTNHKGKGDAWIVKLNNKGDIEWQKTYGGSESDGANCIQQTKDGGYIMSGYTYSTDIDVSNNKGITDYWIVKLDLNGVIEWEKTYGGSNFDVSMSIQTTVDGGYIVAGYASSQDGDVIGYHGRLDFWVLKLDSSGLIEWQKTLGGSNKELALSIIQTFDRGYILCGYTYSNNGDILDQTDRSYSSDSWIVKLNQSGLIEWQKILGDSIPFDEAWSIIQAFDGNYVVAGSSGGYFVQNWYDFDICKISITGDILWQKKFGGSKHDAARSIKQTTDGGYIITGYTSSDDGDVTKNYDYEDFWVVKLSGDGTKLQEDISDSVFSIVAPQASSHDIDLGKVLVNSVKDSVVYNFISNIGSWKFRVDSIYFRGVDAPAFSMLGGFPKYELEPGKSNFTEIRFEPTQVRNYQAEIVIITQADTLIQNIIGEGVKEEITVFGNIIDFGIREIANYKDTTMVLITNNSINSAVISSITMLGPDKEQFEFVNGNVTPITLNSSESYTMTIRFNPKYIGRTSGQIGFFHNETGSPATVQLFGAGIGAQISASYDSAFAGEIIDANIKLESGNLTKFAELIGSFDGMFRVENSILAPVNKSDLSKTQNDSTYIKFSGNVNPNNSTLATLKLKAGLGRVEETSIDFENINWYDTDGNLLEYDTEFSSGHFRLLGICREGGTRLVNPNSQAGMMTIAPNPAENKLDISLSLSEKGQTEICIYNVLGEVVQTLFSEDVVQYNTREISTDLSGLSTGQYLIILKTPTYIESSRLMIIK